MILMVGNVSVNLTLILHLFSLVWPGSVYQMFWQVEAVEKMHRINLILSSLITCAVFLTFAYKTAFIVLELCESIASVVGKATGRRQRLQKSSLRGFSSVFRYWSNLIFSVVVLFCVSVLVCVNMYLYILHVQCAAVCLHRSACAFIWAFFLQFFVVPHNTLTHISLAHTHTH